MTLLYVSNLVCDNNDVSVTHLTLIVTNSRHQRPLQVIRDISEQNPPTATTRREISTGSAFAVVGNYIFSCVLD